MRIIAAAPCSRWRRADSAAGGCCRRLVDEIAVLFVRERRHGPRRAPFRRRLACSRCIGQIGARMIGKLKGIIDSYGEDFIVLDVNGVGYLVQCSARTLQELPGVGQPITLSIETYVREDQIRLFGFRTDVEREWFRLLQTVQGVGAKVALSVLGTLKPADLASAIAMRDRAMVARTPGVGPKVAERIVTELKDKAPAYADLDPAVIRLSGAVEERRAQRGRGRGRRAADPARIEGACEMTDADVVRC